MSYRILKNPGTSKQYKDERLELLERYAPIIFPCRNCQHAVADGYVCETCGCESPSEGVDVEDWA